MESLQTLILQMVTISSTAARQGPTKPVNTNLKMGYANSLFPEVRQPVPIKKGNFLSLGKLETRSTSQGEN